MKILVFGGTFDPVHLGHKKMFLAAQKTIKPDLSLVIPNKKPPLKSAKTIAGAMQRMTMAKIAFEKYENTIVSAWEILNKSNAPSYTFDTLEKIKRKYPKSKIFLLIGGDRYQDFSSWKNHEKIIDIVEKLVVAERNNFGEKNNEKILVLKIRKMEISSKEIRAKLNKKWLEQDIMKYILTTGLYLDSYLRNFMSEHRLQHSIRVANTAIRLAKIHDKKLVNKAYVAGMLHDVCKEFSNDEIKALVGERGAKYPNIHTKHGIAGSIFLKKELGLNDKQILDAIKNHVIPGTKADILTKIIYCADKLEPKRKSKKDVSDRRKYIKLACQDINEAFAKLLEETIKKHT